MGDTVSCDSLTVSLPVYMAGTLDVFRLFKFVNKICCTEYYSEFHETKNIDENCINDSFGMCFDKCHHNNFARRALKPCKVRSFGNFYKTFVDYINFHTVI